MARFSRLSRRPLDSTLNISAVQQEVLTRKNTVVCRLNLKLRPEGFFVARKQQEA